MAASIQTAAAEHRDRPARHRPTDRRNTAPPTAGTPPHRPPLQRGSASFSTRAAWARLECTAHRPPPPASRVAPGRLGGDTGALLAASGSGSKPCGGTAGRASRRLARRLAGLDVVGAGLDGVAVEALVRAAWRRLLARWGRVRGSAPSSPVAWPSSPCSGVGVLIGKSSLMRRKSAQTARIGVSKALTSDRKSTGMAACRRILRRCSAVRPGEDQGSPHSVHQRSWPAAGRVKPVSAEAKRRSETEDNRCQ